VATTDGPTARSRSGSVPDDCRADPTTTPVVEARDVVREYETGGGTLRALKGVDVTVRPGEFVAVVGPSGSGKSTLLNALGLLDVPTSGTVRLDGADAASLSVAERTRTRRRTVGFVFQDFHLLPTLTARRNAMVPRLPAGDPVAAADRAAALLERVGMSDRLDHHPDELSGGQKQRVALARALVNDPDLVLADEPTGSLDRATGERVLSLFERVTDDGVGLVTVTHDELVESYADRTVELVDGRVASDGGREDAGGSDAGGVADGRRVGSVGRAGRANGTAGGRGVDAGDAGDGPSGEA
jgi:putative ABC transport system ATP-binding protein